MSQEPLPKARSLVQDLLDQAEAQGFDAVETEDIVAELQAKGPMNDLLQVCEAGSLSDLYSKWVDRHSGILSLDRMFKYNPVFAESKVRKDVQGLPDLIVVKLIDPRPLDVILQAAQGSPGLTTPISTDDKRSYLLNLAGLARVFAIYRKKNLFDATIVMLDLCHTLDVPDDAMDKLKAMVQKLIARNLMYARYRESRDHNVTLDLVVFYNKLKTPKKQKLILEAILLVGVLIGFLVVFNLYVLK